MSARIFLITGLMASGKSTVAQVLAERVAAKIYAVDFGHDQLHQSVRAMPVVISMEGVNVKDLTREAIAEHVWNYDVHHESNVVDVYIRNLRRKIDDPHPRKLLQTVRGAGYRLTERGAGA